MCEINYVECIENNKSRTDNPFCYNAQVIHTSYKMFLMYAKEYSQSRPVMVNKLVENIVQQFHRLEICQNHFAQKKY